VTTPSCRRRHQGGFTLIELLVVVVILSVLSAVVVFAVRGADDKGRGAAVATDERIVRTALEVYCAKNGTYPKAVAGPLPQDAMQVLVDGKYLSGRSTYHSLATADTFATGLVEGSCPGTPQHYQLGDTGSDGGPGGAKPPDGNPNAKCGDAEGWCPIPPNTFRVNKQLPRPLVQLPSGKVLASEDGRFELYDPAAGPTGTWTPVQYSSSSTNPIIDVMVLIGGKDNECGQHCGQVFIHRTLRIDYYTPYKKEFGEGLFFNPQSETFSQPVPEAIPNFQASGVQMAGLGKILMAGITTQVLPSGSAETHAAAEVYDPVHDIFEPPITGGFLGDSPTVLDVFRPVLAPLGDGRVLIMGVVIKSSANGTYVQENVTRLYDPSTSSFYDATQSNFTHATENPPLVLSDGSVLAVAEVFIPDSGPGAWKVVPSCGSRRLPDSPGPEGVCYPLGTLPDGRVLASNNGSESKTSPDPVLRRDMFLYDPPTRSWTQTGSVNSTLTPGGGVLIQGSQSECGSNCGKFLAAGGYLDIVYTVPGSAELYSPKISPLPLPSPP